MPGDASADIPWFLRAVPQRRPDSIPRPRLTALFDEHLHRTPLLLVAAPSGFGKTTAVADWARVGPDVHWFSVVSAAIAGDVARAVTELIERHSQGMHLTIVVDDAHRLDLDACAATATSSPALMSGHIQLILVGQPQLLDHYRPQIADRTAGVVRVADLRLTDAEFADVTGTAPSAGHGTLGWPLLARLRAVTGGESTLGPDADLADYVEHVLLPSLPDSIAEFVLTATACSRLDRTVAATLTGCPDAASHLDWCHRNGMFLDAHDHRDGNTVYHWHDAFAEACATVLRRTQPTFARDLQARAARALAADFPTDAVEHALAAGETTYAAELIDGRWMTLLLSGLTRTLEELCLRLPPEHREAPDTMAIRACCRHVLGDEAGGEFLHRHLPVDEAPTATRAFAELILARETTPKAAALDVAELMLTPSMPDYPFGLFLLAWSELRLRRAPARAVALLSSAAAEAHSRGLISLADRADANRAFALAFAGRFTAAEEALESRSHLKSVDDWRYDDGVAGMCEIYIQFCRGRLRDAQASAAALVAEIGTAASFAGLARIHLAYATAALDDTAGVDLARSALTSVSDLPLQGLPWGVYKKLATAQLDAVVGDTRRAHRLALDLVDVTGVPVTQALLAELLRRLGDVASSRLVLHRLHHAEPPDYVAAMASTTAAAIDFSGGATESAHRHLARALAISRTEHADYPFAAADSTVRALLGEHARRGSPDETRIARLLTGSETAVVTRTNLTPREREVLGLLHTTMTADEIAASLHVSVSTVRTHTRAIYRKLGVSTRRAAIRAVVH
ncbi:MAG: LuxR C-terminal-related transcriptional regulator [Gordonia sp. (in: high G+C Gram-positive bacteria)]